MIMRSLTRPAKAGTKNWASVPGQLLSAPIPNYIKLNSESGELSWHTTSDTWIPEDGLYDHLALKLGKEIDQRHEASFSDRGLAKRIRMRSRKPGAIDGRSKSERYPHDKSGINFSGDLVPITLLLRWLSTVARRAH
jgi:hypothetical protein